MRSGDPGFRQNFGILDRYLVNEVIARRASEPLSHMLLVAVNPSCGVIPGPIIEANGVDNQGIAFPTPHLVAVEERIGIFLMGAPIRGDHAPVVVQLREFHQGARRPYQLHPMHRPNENDSWGTVWHAISL